MSSLHSLIAALLYTRVSTEEQADADSLAALGKAPKTGTKKPDRKGLSLPTQLAEVRRYVTYQHDWVIEGEYQDILSGKRDDRPGYQRLIADAKRLRAEGRRVVIVVAALDRLGRDIHERVRVWRDLHPDGVEFHSCRDGGLVSEFTFNILASVAAEESRRLAERVTATRQHVRDNGFKAPGRPALGYGLRPSTDDEQRLGAPESVLVPDAATAPTAREAFERVAGGASVRSVAQWIASLPAEARGDRRMTYRAVQLMLAAPVYVARPDEGDDDVLARPVARWEPLVSGEVWCAVRKEMACHAKAGRRPSGRYLLSGFLICSCGQRMHGGTTPGGKRRKDGTKGSYRLYRCERATVGVTNDDVAACKVQFSAKALEAVVVERVAPLLALATAAPEVSAALARAWREMQAAQAPDPSLRARLGQHERAAQKARQRLKNAALLLVDGSLDRQGYQDVKQQSEQDLASAEQELARLRGVPAAPSLPDLEIVLRRLGDWAAIWQKDDVSARRAVLAEFVGRIAPAKVGRGQYTAAIIWTPLGDALDELIGEQVA